VVTPANKRFRANDETVDCANLRLKIQDKLSIFEGAPQFRIESAAWQKPFENNLWLSISQTVTSAKQMNWMIDGAPEEIRTTAPLDS
jgi:hypothetical protein